MDWFLYNRDLRHGRDKALWKLKPFINDKAITETIADLHSNQLQEVYYF